MYKLCNNINEKLINKKVKIFGWIHNKRILKNIIFIKLRDSYGYIQLVCTKDILKNDFINVLNVNIESCIKIRGIVKYKKYSNEKLLEIIVDKFIIIENSINLPINFNDNNISDKTKLKFRYLYLRRSKILDNLKIRSNLIYNINKFMFNRKYIYVETPILSKPTIEGSNNYLVKSRIYKKFYSLSQSPQIFKQMLMISGLNKYYQFAKCFRNENLRTNRQPEFTQLDIESSFVDENYIIKISSDLVKFIFKRFLNLSLKKIPIITYNESINTFGTEKPDIRNPLKIFNLIKILIKNNFFSFKSNEFIYFIPIENNIDYSIINNYNFSFKDIKIKIVNINKLDKDLLSLNISIMSIISLNNIKNVILNSISRNINILIFIIYKKDCLLEIGKFIKYLGIKLNLINNNKFSIIWIKDFPLFKKDKFGKFKSVHHPFTSPKYFSDSLEKVNNIEKIISNSYDLIINGDEIASGSVRITNKVIQKNVFNILNIPENIQESMFGFFLNALQYGTPPHAGIAFGLDRLVMIITNNNNIKNVIAFPKSNSLYDIMINSPSELK